MRRIVSILSVSVLAAACLSAPAYASTETVQSVQPAHPAQPAPCSTFALPTTVSVVRASLAPMPTPTQRSPQSPQSRRATLMFSLMGVLVMGSLTTVAADKDTYPSSDTVRQQLNRFMAFQYYKLRNGMISTTTATFPVIAKGSGNVRPKSTNATVLLNAGAVNAFGAADDAWTLTGAVLAAGKFRKYLLLADASDVCTVQASTDASTAAGCTFENLPADGLAIVGSVTIATDATHPFTPETTHLDATGITTTYYDGLGDDGIFLFSQVTP